MKISEMTPEQQQQAREYNREAKKRQRTKEKAQRQAAAILSADDAFDQFPEEQAEVLDAYVNDVSKGIRSELGLEKFGYFSDEECAVDQVARTLLAFKKQWVRQVHTPDGLLVGGMYFPDVLGSGLVQAVHRCGLEKSVTFSAIYRELLQTLDRRYGKHPLDKDARDIKAELAGTYVLDLPEPEVTEPEAIPEPAAGVQAMPQPEIKEVRPEPEESKIQGAV